MLKKNSRLAQTGWELPCVISIQNHIREGDLAVEVWKVLLDEKRLIWYLFLLEVRFQSRPSLPPFSAGFLKAQHWCSPITSPLEPITNTKEISWSKLLGTNSLLAAYCGTVVIFPVVSIFLKLNSVWLYDLGLPIPDTFFGWSIGKKPPPSSYLFLSSETLMWPYNSALKTNGQYQICFDEKWLAVHFLVSSLLGR